MYEYYQFHMRPIGITKIQSYGTKQSLRSSIPVDVAKKLGLKIPDKLIFCENSDGDVVIRRIRNKL